MDQRRAPAGGSGRLFAAFMLALMVALSAYLLVNATRTNRTAFASVWFLAVLPAFLCMLICYLGDANGDRPVSFYWRVPPVLVAIVLFHSAVILHEGVICLIMLSPAWLISGWMGAFVVRAQRRRQGDGNRLRCSLLLLPLMTGAVESQIPFPHEPVTLTRSVRIRATPDEIWPFALSNDHIGADEGRWTFSQNVLGLPRPRAALMRGAGPGAIRTAYWGDSIDFDEIITAWQPGWRLAWTFSFTNSSIQNFTDQHLSPNGQFLTIEDGEYTLNPLGPEATLLTLTTHYLAKTHVNAYAKLWGEVLLGDVQDNILAIVQQRAEASHRAAAGAAVERHKVSIFRTIADGQHYSWPQARAL